MHPAGKLVTLAANAKNMTSGSRQWLLMTAVAVSAVLAGCSSTSERAPITDLSVSSDETVAQITESQSSKEYTVQPGDTLYKIAREHNAKVHEIAQANQITDPSQLSVGQTLIVPGAGSAPSSPPDISSGSQVVAAPVDVSGSEAQAKPVKTPEPDQTKAEPDKSKEGSSAPRASDADLIKWGWPNQGKVIKEFTPSSKGIDIAGQVGDPVVAAADGKVMYAGNGVRGLGNLILLGHSDGFITAYAHNDELLVKMGEQVKKGQKVATLGESEADSPRLHFEIRRRGTPVNPMSYLPKK